MIIIRHAKIYTMEPNAAPFTGDILLDADRILEIGIDLSAPGGKVIDAKGLICVPGLIDAHSHIGLQEGEMGWEGNNTDEIADPVAPHLSAFDAVNPQDPCFQEALSGGITAVATGPGSANVLGGQFTLLKTAGSTVQDMVIRKTVALKAAFGENPRMFYGLRRDRAPVTRMGTAGILRLALEDAQAALAMSQPGSNALERARNQALAGLLKHEYPLKVHVHRLDDICTVLRIGEEFGIEISLEHASDAWKMPEAILEAQKNHSLKLVIGQFLSGQRKVESLHRTAASAAVLAAHGIRFALMTDHPAIPCQYLSVQAGVLVREGLDPETALASITRDAAWTLGVSDQMGTLTAGKKANLALWDAHPLEMNAHARLVILDGRVVYER